MGIIVLVGGSELEEPTNCLDEIDPIDGLASLLWFISAVLPACEEITSRLTGKNDAIVHLQSWNSAKGPYEVGSQ